MTLSKLLDHKLILTKYSSSSKDDLLSKLVDHIYSADIEFPIPKNDLLEVVQKREQIGGTMFPSGLSVPHARLSDFEGFIIALATPNGPIFHEGIQLRLMSLLISSQTGGLYYLPTIAALAKISKDSEYLSRLTEADNPQLFIELIEKQDPHLN